MKSDRTVRELAADVAVAAIVGGAVDNQRHAINRVLVATGLTRVDLERAAARHTGGNGLLTIPFSASFDFDPVPGPTKPAPVPPDPSAPGTSMKVTVREHGPSDIEFGIVEKSPLVGVCCGDCGAPFEEDDDVVASAFVTHRECP